jgi:glycosyltransferase 2 family protein
MLDKISVSSDNQNSCSVKETLEEENQFTKEQVEVLRSIRVSKIILPILIGIAVVGYLLWEKFNAEDFSKIEWNAHIVFWLTSSFCFLVIRHMAYALRLRVLSDYAFTWRKCIELIFIWEFSSAVTPTSVGGSAVALFVLSQEKLSAARTATIVIYSAVLDTLFFVSTLLCLYLIFGRVMIRPYFDDGAVASGLEWAFFATYLFMLFYGSLFFFGLFINSKSFGWALNVVTNIGFLKKYKNDALQLGKDMDIASNALKEKRWKFHLVSFLSTGAAWSCRFILLGCLVIAFKPGVISGFMEHLQLYGRLESVYVIMAGSPTPGAAGVAEFTFSKLIKDYVPETGIALLIASLWRFWTYYLYLLIGAIVIPNWIRKILNARLSKRKAKG